MSPPVRRRVTFTDWQAEGVRLFGEDRRAWRFICPACGHVASVADWMAAGAKEGEVGFSCIGRRQPKPRDAFVKGEGPCNYAGGGLFRLNPVTVVGDVDSPERESELFEFFAGGAT